MSDDDKELLNNFFDINIEWLQKHDFNEKYNIEKFKSRLANYILLYNLQDNITFKIFMHDIEYELLLLDEDLLDKNLVKKNKKNTYSTTFINNNTLNKWYLMAKFEIIMDKRNLNEINNSIDKPKIKQKKYFSKVKAIVENR